MKYAIVVPDGLADFPLEELDGRTPIEVARVPNIHAVSQAGKLGTVLTIPAGIEIPPQRMEVGWKPTAPSACRAFMN